MLSQPNDDQKESLRLEYKLAQEMHTYYGKILWQIGSIFLPVSLAGFVFGIRQEISNDGLLALTVFLTALLIWFIFSAIRLRRLAFVYMERCRKIEKILSLKQHNNKARDDKNTVKIRGKEIKIFRKKLKWRHLAGKNINLPVPIFFIIIFWTYYFFQAVF